MSKDDIINAFNELENNYRLIALNDCYDEENVLGIIYLNNKHSVQEFQNAINKAKNDKADEINEYGNDWEIISSQLTDFDYIEVGNYETEDYVVY